jgi:predicted AlkP superfamily pyrophosphatase or phosphodiesterase
MKRWFFFVLSAILFSTAHEARGAGKADHVVVVVWDGLRPDFVRPQYTPTLFEFANKGTFFRNHHSAFVSSTEVNATALATGMHPDHSGVVANTEYRPDLGWLGSYSTEGLDAIRRGDSLSGGHYLEAATVPEILQAAGFPTITAGAKPVTLLQDRDFRKKSQAQKDSVTLFRGQTLPRSLAEKLVAMPDIGLFPTNVVNTNASSTTTNVAAAPARRARRGEGPNTADGWTTKALVRGLWKNGVPKYSLLWLGEPDGAQHAHGLGSDEAVAALGASDDNFAAVLKALEDKEVLDKTDVFVVSDHGFSSVGHGPDLIQSLQRAKFTAGKQFENPEPGDVMVVSLGGSTAFYVFDHDEAVIRRLVAYLQSTDFAGVVFSGISVEGTFPLSQAHIAAKNGAPDVLVSMRWSDEKNEHGVPGLIVSSEGKRGLGTHASLSRFDLHNTLVAAGPDIKTGFINELPSGNIDLAPTILHLLDVNPSTEMDGRILTEALAHEEGPAVKPAGKTVEASRDLGLLTWHQYLRFTQCGSAVYYEEGNGESRLREPATGPQYSRLQ